MKHMGIKGKLYLAFGVMILLLATISLLVFFTSRNLIENNKEVIKEAAFESQIRVFQKQHSDWLIALSNHLFTGAKFDKALNPRECAFGKWYYSYMDSDEFKSLNPEIQNMLRELEAPHRQLHKGGAAVINELKNGNFKAANKFYIENTMPTITKLDGIYSSLVETIRDLKDRHTENAGKAEAFQKLLVILVMIVGILCGLGVAFMLSKHIIKMVNNVLVASESVAHAAEELSIGNQDLAKRTQEQASALEETSSTMEQMTATIKQNADNAQKANSLSKETAIKASEGRTIVEETISAINEVVDSSRRVADIINVINEISFQTNLLALNAAVEAARAGEQGKGFAVVAGEVRNLAQRSSEAAKEIQELIEDSLDKVTKGKDLVEESGKTLMDIIGAIQQVADIVSEISHGSQEQAAGIDQVNKAILTMDEAVQQNSSLVEEAAAASQSLAMEADELQKLMSSFKGNADTSFKKAHQQQGNRESKSLKIIPLTKSKAEKTGGLKAMAAGAENLEQDFEDGFDTF